MSLLKRIEQAQSARNLPDFTENFIIRLEREVFFLKGKDADRIASSSLNSLQNGQRKDVINFRESVKDDVFLTIVKAANNRYVYLFEYNGEDKEDATRPYMLLRSSEYISPSKINDENVLSLLNETKSERPPEVKAAPVRDSRLAAIARMGASLPNTANLAPKHLRASLGV